MVGTLMVWLRFERFGHRWKSENQEGFHSCKSELDQAEVLPWWARERQSSDGGKRKTEALHEQLYKRASKQLFYCIVLNVLNFKCLRAVPLPAPTSAMINTK